MPAGAQRTGQLEADHGAAALGVGGARAVPPCSSATRCTIASPRPEPGLPRASSERQKRSNTFGRSSVAKARAVVADRDPARPRPRSRPRPRRGSTWRRCRAGSRSRGRAARGRRGRPRGRGRSSKLSPRARRRARSTASRGELVEARRPARSSAVRARARGPARRRRRPASVSSSSSSVTSSTIRSRSARSSSSAAPERLDVGPQRRQRRAQLVRGVGDQAPLRRLRALQRLHHLVEARGQPPELVVAADLDPPGQVAGPRHLLGRARRPRRPGRARCGRRPARAPPRARSRRR